MPNVYLEIYSLVVIKLGGFRKIPLNQVYIYIYIYTLVILVALAPEMCTFGFILLTCIYKH